MSLVVGLVLMCGCARDAALVNWSNTALRAERKLEQGHLDEARHTFRTLEKSAHSSSDAAYARLRQAETYRRAGRYGQAQQLLNRLIDVGRTLDIELQAKILYRRARLYIDMKRWPVAERQLNFVIDRFPNATYGLRSFAYLRGRYRTQDPQAFVKWCRDKYRRLSHSELADNFVFRAAQVYFERKTAKDDRRALKLYRIITKRWNFQTSPLWDDAMWDISLILHRQQRYREEIALLHKLLSTREWNWLWGSYDISNYKWAVFRIAKIYYNDLQDYAAAAREFATYPSRFKKSRFKDDALWWEGHSWQRAGHADKAKRAFQLLLKKYPKSKYARRVRDGAPGP